MMLYRMLNASDRAEFDPSVLSILTPGEMGRRIEKLNVIVDSLGQEPGQLSFATIPRLARALRNRRPHIIQGWMYHGNFAASIGAMLFCRPSLVVWSVHHALSGLNNEKPLTQKIIHLSKHFSSGVAAIIYCSKASARQHEAFGFDPKRTIVIPNGIDCAQFIPGRAAGRTTRRQLGIPDNRFLIGMAARDHPVKGHITLIEAAAKLVASKVEVHALLVGRGVDDRRGKIETLVRENGLEDRVTLLGQRNDLPTLMRSLDLYVSASLWSEAFPLVVAEAMASGIPVVATDLGDCREIVGSTGEIVKPGNANMLADAIRHFAERSPEERFSQGEAARQRIVTNYALTDIVERYQALYRNLVSKSNYDPDP